LLLPLLFLFLHFALLLKQTLLIEALLFEVVFQDLGALLLEFFYLLASQRLVLLLLALLIVFQPL